MLYNYNNNNNGNVYHHQDTAVARVHPAHLTNIEQCRLPTFGPNQESRVMIPTATISAHHLLLLLNKKADIHFIIYPLKV